MQNKHTTFYNNRGWAVPVQHRKAKWYEGDGVMAFSSALATIIIWLGIILVGYAIWKLF